MQVECEGATVHAEVDGNPKGAPLLLWNGAGCTLRMWDHVVPRLADRYRVIRFDVRGSGESTPAADPAQYTLGQYAEDANRILDRLQVAQTRLWSMAWGSRAGLAYCALHPARVHSAMLSDASIGPPPTWSHSWRDRGGRSKGSWRRACPASRCPTAGAVTGRPTPSPSRWLPRESSIYAKP